MNARQKSQLVSMLKMVIALVMALLGKRRAGGSSGPTQPRVPSEKSSTRSTTRSPERSPERSPARSPARSSTRDSPRESTRSSASVIPELFRNQQSDTIVECSGEVVHILPDDNHDLDGSGRHQQFLVDVGEDVTIKIAHNLKFGRAPVEKGDHVTFKGEYEYNDRGGCIHWTHHDPAGRHEDGWLEHNGTRYE